MPLIFVLPIVPAHATAVGRIAAPPAVTRTVARTAEPAFGFAGETSAALADATAGVSPPEGWVTTMVAEAVLLERSGSVTDVCVISALTT